MRVLSFDVGIRNLAIALIELKEDDEQKKAVFAWDKLHLEHWERIDVLQECGCEAKHCNKVAMDRCVKMLGQVLHNRPQLTSKPIDAIVVEKQMGKAPRNLMAGVALICYYQYRNLFLNTASNNTAEARIEFMHAANKFKLECREGCKIPSIHAPIEYKPKMTPSQKKTLRKNKAIQICSHFLASNPNLQKWHNFFEIQSADKKDDIADCLLQGIAYLQAKTKGTTKRLRKRKATKSEK